jgi:hypothetical protein
MATKSRVSFVLIVSAVVLAIAPAVLQAGPMVNIKYEVANLGGNLWQYQYFLSYDTPAVFEKGQGFAVLFNLRPYAGLQNPLPISPDWTILAYQPDPNLPAPGEFDAVAQTTDPLLPSAFSVEFFWTGIGRPGRQSFQVWDFSVGATLLGEGTTVPAVQGVPEPGTFVLLGLGLAALSAIHTKVR